jgi:hypothetical protein
MSISRTATTCLHQFALAVLPTDLGRPAQATCLLPTPSKQSKAWMSPTSPSFLSVAHPLPPWVPLFVPSYPLPWIMILLPFFLLFAIIISFEAECKAVKAKAKATSAHTAKPPSNVVLGLDTCGAYTTKQYKNVYKKKEKYRRLVVRAYQEAWGVGGQVDKHFAKTFINANAAGFKMIDAYMFPCTHAFKKPKPKKTPKPQKKPASKHPKRELVKRGAVVCKEPETQVKELLNAIRDAEAARSTGKYGFGYIWLDVEIDPALKTTGHNWPYGKAGNLKVINRFAKALSESGRKWGVYSSSGEWASIAGSGKINYTCPLWEANWDGSHNLTMKRHFGGWKHAYGKQYGGNLKGGFDLNVFPKEDEKHWWKDQPDPVNHGNMPPLATNTVKEKHSPTHPILIPGVLATTKATLTKAVKSHS